MRRLAHMLLVLLAGTVVASGQEPPPPEPGSAPAPAPAAVPVTPEASAPPLVALPAVGFFRPDQSPFGAQFPASPAQGLAMMEAGRPLFPNDPWVAAASTLLSQATASYVEDAPRIAELTVRIVGEVRAANQPASPLEMLAGAIQWKRSPNTPGNIPRKFEEFAGRYRKLRSEGKDHATALSSMQPTRPSDTPVP